jgi:hypothetical protein
MRRSCTEVVPPPEVCHQHQERSQVAHSRCAISGAGHLPLELPAPQRTCVATREASSAPRERGSAAHTPECPVQSRKIAGAMLASRSRGRRSGSSRRAISRGASAQGRPGAACWVPGPTLWDCGSSACQPMGKKLSTVGGLLKASAAKFDHARDDGRILYQSRCLYREPCVVGVRDHVPR